ncbi:MAG TPA: GNAT family N-acetyltransferase [Pseudonocardiaceae bacterium]|jgi:GNAT superfamily N-acetyltransferase
MTGIDVRPAGSDDASYIHGTLADGFGDTVVVGHGEMIDAAAQPTLVAWRGDERVGLLTYRSHPDQTACEIVTINTTTPGIGAGAALIDAVRERARRSGAVRLWLVTTNDNTHALRFYQRNGFDLTALSYDAVTLARALKPSIPEVLDGIALRHELVLERRP